VAQTTTAFNACDVSIWLDDSTNTLRELSGSSNSVEANFDHDIGEYVTFDSKWPNRLECGKDASFTLNIICSETANEAWDIIKDWYFAASPGARTFRFYMPDKNVGSDRFSCEARIQNFTFTGDRSEPGPIMVTATLLPDGEVTHSDVAT